MISVAVRTENKVSHELKRCGRSCIVLGIGFVRDPERILGANRHDLWILPTRVANVTDSTLRYFLNS